MMKLSALVRSPTVARRHALRFGTSAPNRVSSKRLTTRCRTCRHRSPQFNRCFNNVRQTWLAKRRMLCRIHRLFRHKKREQRLVQVALASPNAEPTLCEFGVSTFYITIQLHGALSQVAYRHELACPSATTAVYE